MNRPYPFVTALLAITGIALATIRADELSAFQPGVSATPVRITLPDAATADFQNNATSPPARTPTPAGSAFLEAKTEANVRTKPDIESERLGTIRAGDIYPIIGRYFRWLQFQFPTAADGRGWVFDDLVTIKGNVSAIPNLDPNALPTIDGAAVASTATFQAITQTPGGLLTATAIANTVSQSGNAASSFDQSIQPESTAVGASTPELLPTFTYPPNVPTLALSSSVITPSPIAEAPAPPIADRISSLVSAGLPPIVPILVLAGLGIIGLLIGIPRR